MEIRKEIAGVLKYFSEETLTTDEAIDSILSLFSVVGRSEQLPSCDKCGYYIHPENKTCLREGCENY